MQISTRQKKLTKSRKKAFHRIVARSTNLLLAWNNDRQKMNEIELCSSCRSSSKSAIFLHPETGNKQQIEA